MSDPNYGSTQLQASYRAKLAAFRTEADAMRGVLQQLVHEAEEVLERGGELNVQPKMGFLIGAHARLLKDYGALEHFQAVMQLVLKRRPKGR